MVISTGPSSTSVITQPKCFLSPRSAVRMEESQLTLPETASQLSEASQVPDPSTKDQPPPSQEIHPQETQEISSEDISHTHKPIFIARDFAGLPPPAILPFAVDERWVVHLNAPKNPVPGLRERLAEEWEEQNKYLFRLEGNRADPRNAITKTWGGRSKSEDDKLMRHLEQRAIDIERMKQCATALGLTPTEPNIGGPPPGVRTQLTQFDPEAAARADAYRQQCEAESIAAGHGPLIKTPTNSPPPERARRRGFPLPPPVTPPPLGRQSSSKRKLDESDAETNELERPVEPSRKRRHRRPDANDAKSSLSNPARYSLRRPQADSAKSTPSPSPKSSPKQKAKGKGKTKNK